MGLKELMALWEKKLEDEGMPAKLPEEKLGKKKRLGRNGLGWKSEAEEDLEDSGKGHSQMCPINLGYSVGGSNLDQPNDRPVERAVFEDD